LRNGGDPFAVHHAHGRFKDEAEARKAHQNLTDTATVTEVRQKSATRPPPTPFNTTGFLTAAASLGIGPSRAARIAEDLYTDGYISYPRTDNTVYPRSLDLREVLGQLKRVEGVGQYAEKLLASDKLSPTRGKRETTDHPPIYPTGYASRKALRDDQWKIYQLVVRRFLATLSGPAKTLRTTLRFDSGGETLTTSGTVVTEEGWLGVYFYGRRADEELPALNEGDEVDVVEAEVLSKETQPPGRYGQGRLIKLMEDLGLGTKATRPNIIQNLYDRGYVHDDPLIPTEKGIALARALKDFASEIASHEMTSELETSMDAISEGRTSKKNVVDESRDVLRRVYENLTEAEKEFADIVWDGIRGDETLGKCPESGHNLIIRRNRKSGKRFVGCQGYPECRVTYPLPQKGTIIPLHTQCDACGSPEIKVLGGKRPWVTCINIDCPKKQEQRENREEGGEGLSSDGAQEPVKSTT
jgi:DNA topoisomerase-1